MRRMASATLGMLLALGFSGGSASAQEPTPAQIHLDHVVGSFVGVPEGQGLLQVAMADARVAAQHAALGAQDPSNLGAMKTHAGHIIHALDPRRIDRGPGSGYGLLRAADMIGRHAQLAGRAAGGTPQMATHAGHVAASAQNTRRRADQIVALAQTVADHVEDAENAAALYVDIQRLAEQLVSGVDANGDGQIGWQEGEGGLQHVQQHIEFMRQSVASSGR
jgi:hypothetical protein